MTRATIRSSAIATATIATNVTITITTIITTTNAARVSSSGGGRGAHRDAADVVFKRGLLRRRRERCARGARADASGQSTRRASTR